MLNSTEHEKFPAHKCYNANNCWHFNICELENSILSLTEPKMSQISCYFFTYEKLKFHAQQKHEKSFITSRPGSTRLKCCKARHTISYQKH